MATSGIVYSSSARSSCLYVSWSIGDTDVANNRTRIDWTAGIIVESGNLWYSNAVKINSIYIDGGDSLGSGTYSNITSNGTHAKLSGSKWVYHNDEGNKKISVSINGWFYSSYNVSGSNNFDLPTIPRASGVSATSGYIGSPMTISISRHASSFTHTLRYYFGNATGDIEIGPSETTVSWTPDISLCEELPKDASGWGTIVCDTYNGGESPIGSSQCRFDVSVPTWVQLGTDADCASVTFNNEGTAAEKIPEFVQGYSKAKVTFLPEKIDTTNAYGAKPDSFSISFEGINYTKEHQTGVINSAGAKQITCYVTDTRGRTTSFNLPFTVQAYSPPTLSDVSIFRCTENGFADDNGYNISATAKETHSDLNGHNSIVFDVGYAVQGGSIGERKPMVSGSPSIIGDGYISTSSTYVVEIRLIDDLGKGAVYTDYVPTEEVFLHGGEGGTSAGLGKPPERDNVFDIAWDLQTRGDLYVGEEGHKMADFVIDEGIALGSNYIDQWHYRKWRSGKVELWTRQSVYAGQFYGDTAGVQCSSTITIPWPVGFNLEGASGASAFVSLNSVGTTLPATVCAVPNQGVKFSIVRLYDYTNVSDVAAQVYVFYYNPS